LPSDLEEEKRAKGPYKGSCPASTPWCESDDEFDEFGKEDLFEDQFQRRRSSIRETAQIAAEAAKSAAPAAKKEKEPGVFKVNDEVEVWSKSAGKWMPGRVDRVLGDNTQVKYKGADGHSMYKTMPNEHAHIRHASTWKIPLDAQVDEERTNSVT
jgi:hypothetical protein